MRIGSLVTGISARDNDAAYLKGPRFSRDASRDINLPVESIFPHLSIFLGNYYFTRYPHLTRRMDSVK